MGFGQEEVSTSRGSRKGTRARFRLECQWLTLAPFMRADSMGADDDSLGRGAPRQPWAGPAASLLPGPVADAGGYLGR